jgi:CheY-like chemotaxis protein
MSAPTTLRIVVVDDHKTVRETVANSLTRRRRRTTMGATALLGLDAVQAEGSE